MTAKLQLSERSVYPYNMCLLANTNHRFRPNLVKLISGLWRVFLGRRPSQFHLGVPKTQGTVAPVTIGARGLLSRWRNERL